MIETIVSTLKSGLELAFLLAVLGAFLKNTERAQLLRPLRMGSFLALIASPILAYGVTLPLKREIMVGDTSLLAAAVTAGSIIWIGSNWRYLRHSLLIEPNTAARGAPWILIFAVSAILVFPRGLDIAMNLIKLVQANGLSGTDQLARALLAIVVLAIAALVGVTLRKSVVQVGPRRLASIAMLSLSILLLQDATTAVQVMLAQGKLPLAGWLFRIIVVLVNNYSAFYYALLAAACALVLLATWARVKDRPSHEGLNPAQARKIRAAARHLRFLIAMVSVLLVLVILVDGASAVYVNNPPSLSPTTPVASQGDVVIVPTDSVSDGMLHRFSFATADGTVVKFLVIHKGSGIFGVGLDACDICGVSGYRQDDKNVICNRCGAAINIATIGLPGGCNPIPLKYQKDETALAIPVDALQAASTIFSR